MKTISIGVILAGGSGIRSKQVRPKQLLKLAGRPVVEYSIEAFERHEAIDHIIVVASAASKMEIQNIVNKRLFRKVKSIILGGDERYKSSIAAIEAVKRLRTDQNVNLIYHDAVRPLLSQEIITSVIEALEEYGAVDVAIPSTDTIIEVNEKSNTIKSIPNRKHLMNGQTPQGFRFDVIEKAYNIALKDKNFESTDDCGVVIKYLPNEPIKIVNGSQINVKLTYPEDLYVIDKLIQIKNSKYVRSFEEEELHTQLKGKIIIIYGGTSGIGKSIANLLENIGSIVEIASRKNGVDIANIEQVMSFTEDILEKHGRIDAVINTAAVLITKPYSTMSADEINTSVAINYLGALNVMSASFSALKRSQGSILNFTSSSYTYGRANYSVYSSSKAAIVNLTQALSDEWYEHNIKVNCINPERTDTPMRKEAFGFEDPDTLLSSEEVASASVNLLASGLTGQILEVRK